MYKPDREKLQAYFRGEGESKRFDWHAWLKNLSESEEKELKEEILLNSSRNDLSDYARQYYLHFCTDTADGMLRGIEHDFVTAQIEERPLEEIEQFEDKYFERARELLKQQEKD